MVQVTRKREFSDSLDLEYASYRPESHQQLILTESLVDRQ